ncbi:unnamed protein product [Mytilus edulis]|uniref:Integrase core domain-containing protein n=1 Tax=Mytilus edulis TaxID=6550 RepID=A0A8S3TNL9_MYTED|nr:unnamed protein product [Mytilus edulis]
MTEGNKNRDIQREVSRIGDTFQLSFIKNSYSSCIDSLQKSANETLDDRNKAILLSKINLLHELNFRKSMSLEECYEEYLGMVPRKWGMVIHGGIDGFSRMVTFINLALDNKAATALEPFVRGCQEFGVPSRVRTDHGRENLDIARFMLTHRGANRGSIITGRSVHNQRIELH